MNVGWMVFLWIRQCQGFYKLCMLYTVFSRLRRVLQQNAQYLPRVLEVFLGSTGMGHPDKVVTHLQHAPTSCHSCCSLWLVCADSPAASSKARSLLPGRS